LSVDVIVLSGALAEFTAAAVSDADVTACFP
jgi:hypothetical protein